jgi:endonuclease/exonuclease/phosphatase (EEP) superfamily protein YafD
VPYASGGSRHRRLPPEFVGPAPALRTAVIAGVLPVLVAACVSITAEPRALLQRDDGSIEVQSIACGAAVSVGARSARTVATTGLDPAGFRIVTWNIHKQEDDGWQRDLRGFTAGNDVVLLQETVLDAPLSRLIEDSGLRWVMASSFLYADVDIGVLTAARLAPLAACTQRVVEPLLRLPKSAVITWFPLRGEETTLAVVNVHAINFSLLLGAYRAQFDAIADALAAHDGPIVMAGDLNTWTAERTAIVNDVAARLGLAEIAFNDDRRRLFFGHELDHVYTRGLETLEASATAVTSSDHNPVAATLRLSR